MINNLFDGTDVGKKLTTSDHADISGHVLLPEMSLGNQVMKVQVKAFLLKHLYTHNFDHEFWVLSWLKDSRTAKIWSTFYVS